jgi:hypothetical protein
VAVAELHGLADDREDEAGAVEALHPEGQGEALAGESLGAGELAEAVGAVDAAEAGLPLGVPRTPP